MTLSEAMRKHVVNTYGGYSRKVRRFFSTSNPLVYRLRMAHRIQHINTKLAKRVAEISTFGLQIINQDPRVVHVREMTHSHVKPSNVTGREHDKNEIVKLLVQDAHHQSLSVIPIVGMGGLGKTTLAKLVFNDTNIDACFSLKMWVCVSNDFKLENVLIKILNSAPNPTSENFNNFGTEQLKNRLRNTLQGQKFLLVLDDVWNDVPQRWNELKEIIDSDVEGSKILVTTRSHAVVTAMHVESSNSYLLQCLSEEDSLSLFMKSAFEEGNEKKHPQLVEIGKEIVKKCGGLPLAVKTVGSSLFWTVDKKEWESTRDSEIWNMKQNEKDILPALKLSYDQLPSYLKPCFASFAFFRDYNFILTSHTSVLWGALGFLPPPKVGESMVDVASRFLDELWKRSFISEYAYFGGEGFIRLHDLVHDLAVYIGKGQFERIDSGNPKISESTQHVVISKINFYGKSLLPTGLRTIILSPNEGISKNLLNTLVSRCKCLRVLMLADFEYESWPNCIGKLKHLRVLSLEQNKKLKKLPDSVCKLQNLESLILTGCIKLQTLPKGIKNLMNLRFLAITSALPDFPKQAIANWTCLERIGFSDCDNLVSLFEGVQISTLKSLYLSNCRSLKSVSFHSIGNLELLYISNCDKLELSMGGGSQIPNSRLTIIVFDALPQLVTLPQWLQGSANSIKSMTISNCTNLEELPKWIPSLICLKKLEIKNCPNLMSLPDNMDHATNVEVLQIYGCPELCKRLKPEVGQDWHKISHIKEVDIDEGLFSQ